MNEGRRKRILGCGGWAVILSFLAPSSIGIVGNASAGHFSFNVFTGWKLLDFMSVFTFILIPAAILSMVIGSRTKPGPYWHSAVIIIPLVAAGYTGLIYLSVVIGQAISDTPSRVTFWQPPAIGLSAITVGVILGYVASYGYWHAGRKKSESGRL